MLHAARLAVVVLERQASDHVQALICAGVLERVTVDITAQLGLDSKLRAEGPVESGFSLADGEQLNRIDVAGQTVPVYGQSEIQRDLIAADDARGPDVRWQVSDIVLDEVTSDRPRLACLHNGSDLRIDCCATISLSASASIRMSGDGVCSGDGRA